jgi:hypothetical protein
MIEDYLLASDYIQVDSKGDYYVVHVVIPILHIECLPRLEGLPKQYRYLQKLVYRRLWSGLR